MARKKTKLTKQTVANGPISVKELKFWLAGFLDMQDEGWCPNAEQWEKIKGKIFNLEDTPAPVMAQGQAQRPVQGVPNVFQPEGGATGLTPQSFPTAHPDQVFAESIDISKLPRKDANGFLIPADGSVSHNPVPASGGTVRKFNPNVGFD